MNVVLMKYSASTAMVGLDFSYSYTDVYVRILKARDALGKGLEKVAIFAENAPEWCFALYGAWMTGSTVVPIDAKSSADEVAFIMGDSEAGAMCVGRDNLETAKLAIAKLEKAPKLIVLEDLFAGELPQPDKSEWVLERPEEDLAFIVYTSGTTGAPKGVMLTFANMYANMKAVAEAQYYTDGIRVLIMLPFHHILPLMGTLVMPLSVRGKLVFPRSISPTDIAEVLQAHSVDMVISVPRFFELLHTNIMAKIRQSKAAKTLFNVAKLIGSQRLSRKLFGTIHKKFGGEIKFWISGGATLDRKVWRDLDVLGFAMREGYGMTECSPIITFPRISRIKVGSPGQALPGVEIRVVDGEITVRGKNVTQGYYKRPEETAESIKNGWLHTGDLGHLDEDGFLFITGRRKEIIVLANGKNLNPAEMEAQIKQQSEEALEVGVLMYENILQAIVRVDPALVERLGTEGAQEHIRNTVILPYNRMTATYRRIIRFAVTTEELPRTRVGKLKRFQLAAYLENISNEPRKPSKPEPQTQTYAQLRKALESQITMKVRPDAHMELDLGLDSLGKISMQCFIKENYGLDVSERDFEKYPTLRALDEFVEGNRDAHFEPDTKDVTWADIITARPFPTLPKPHFFHFASVALFKFLTGLFYNIEYKGLENLPDDEALLITPNHESYVDSLFVIKPFSKTQMYKTFFFAKIRSIIKSGFIRNFARRSNVIIMDINDKVSESIREMAQALRLHNRVIIFPEGTRTKDGRIAEFKQSFAILAKEMRLPVMPVAIRGAYEALKPGGTFPKFGAKIKVHFLPLMRAFDSESYQDFSSRVRDAVEREWETMV